MSELLGRIGLILPRPLDLIQILVVAAALYYVLRLLHRTRAISMLVGVGVLASIYFIATFIRFALIQRILEVLFSYGAIAALIVFAPELRAGLARLGQNRMLRMFSRLEQHAVAGELAESVARLARVRIGAIIGIEGEVGLGEYAATGTGLDARVGAELLVTIFSPHSPLHDGAVLVRGDSIIAAGVILPLTQYPVADRTLGTRHRAAIGLSEETDALVLVVSEETGHISIARRGRLERDVAIERVREVLGGAPESAAEGEEQEVGEQQRKLEARAADAVAGSTKATPGAVPASVDTGTGGG